jgi:hypothetical protein
MAKVKVKNYSKDIKKVKDAVKKVVRRVSNMTILKSDLKK